jgi:hypothetical protein
MERDRSITLLLQRVINVMDKQQRCVSAGVIAESRKTRYIYDYIMERIKVLGLHSPFHGIDVSQQWAHITIANLPDKYQLQIKGKYSMITTNIMYVEFRMLFWEYFRIKTTVIASSLERFIFPDMETIDQTVDFMNTIFPNT